MLINPSKNLNKSFLYRTARKIYPRALRGITCSGLSNLINSLLNSMEDMKKEFGGGVSVPRPLTPEEKKRVEDPENIKLVEKIAYKLVSKLRASVEVDDLKQAGYLGLIQAAQNYDANRGASFSTHAYYRIRGAMLDYLRNTQDLPRNIHRVSREADKILREANNTGDFQDMVNPMTTNKAVEIAAARVNPGSKIHLQTVLLTQLYKEGFFLHLGHPMGDGEGTLEDRVSQGLWQESHNPEQLLDQEQQNTRLAQAIQGLPNRLKTVLHQHINGRTLNEIGADFGVTESRASQLRKQAHKKLQKTLRGDGKDSGPPYFSR